MAKLRLECECQRFAAPIWNRGDFIGEYPDRCNTDGKFHVWPTLLRVTP